MFEVGHSGIQYERRASHVRSSPATSVIKDCREDTVLLGRHVSCRRINNFPNLKETVDTQSSLLCGYQITTHKNIPLFADQPHLLYLKNMLVIQTPSGLKLSFPLSSLDCQSGIKVSIIITATYVEIICLSLFE